MTYAQSCQSVVCAMSVPYPSGLDQFLVDGVILRFSQRQSFGAEMEGPGRLCRKSEIANGR